MLIIEGTDAVGKTVLAKKFVEELPDHVYRHLSRLTDSFDRFWGYVEHASSFAVQDRYHMSEIAYTFARAEQQVMPSLYYSWVDGFLRFKPAYTVVITADETVIRRRYEKLDQMYDVETVIRANTAFKRIVIGQFPGYNCDFSYHIHLTEEEPWVTNADIQIILKNYRQLMDVFAGLMSRKPITTKFSP